MSDKVRIALARHGRQVFMQVLEMPERLRGKEFGGYYRGFQFYSCHYPSLHHKGIYLWGDQTDREDLICHDTFASRDEAQDYVEKLSVAVRAFNKSLAAPEAEPKITLTFEIVE